MKKLVYLLIVFAVWQSQAQKVYVDEKYGWDPTDASDYYYDAITGEAGTGNTLIFRDMGSPWYITRAYRMFDINDLTIIFEPGCVIEAKDNYWTDNEKLFEILRADNLHIIGYGAKFVMHKDDFPNDEFGMSISTIKLTNSSIKGLEFDGSGGDAIYAYQSKNILVADIYAHDQKRQGITINKCDGFTILNSRFEDTEGTRPMDGIDIEPDIPTDTIRNVLIDNCVFKYNYGSGVRGAMAQLDATSDTLSIVVKNSYFSNNSQAPASGYPPGRHIPQEMSSGRTGMGYSTTPLGGHFVFENCVIDSSPSRAIYSTKNANDYELKYKNVVMYNTPSVDSQGPIYLETNYDPNKSFSGGIDFDNVLSVYNNPYQAIRYQAGPTTYGLKDVTGKITVKNPNSISGNINFTGPYDGSTNDNITVSINQFSTLPTTTVGIETNQLKAVRGGQEGRFKVTRSSSKIDYPIFVKYAVDLGTITMQNEISLLTGAVVIPAGETSAYIPVTARDRQIAIKDKALKLTLEARTDLYTIGSDNTATVVVSDALYSREYLPPNTLHRKRGGVFGTIN